METHTHIADVRAGVPPVCLSLDQRLRHLAALGGTGVGKSSLLRHLAAEDMARGDGLLLLDPHGDLAHDVLGDVPRWRRNQVCYLNLPDLDFPVALNVLDDPGLDERAAAVDAVVSAMRAIWAESWGPRMETILRHAAMALMAAPGASLVQLPRFLTDEAFRVHTLRHTTDPLTLTFFERRFDGWREVALNDAIMIFAFAPIVALLLGLSAIVVPWQTLLLSVLLYIVVPVILAQVIRRAVLASSGQAGLQRLLTAVQPMSLLALLATLVLLFAFQGPQILAQPLVIASLAVPILIQVYFNAGLAYILNRWTGEAHCVAAPSALIGASNFFELAVAAAIGLFGLNSGAALATVVGVLIEVPVMLSVVKIVNTTRPWYEAGAAVKRNASSALRS